MNVHEVHEQPDPSHSSRVPYVGSYCQKLWHVTEQLLSHYDVEVPRFPHDLLHLVFAFLLRRRANIWYHVLSIYLVFV
jgi:hypothetical protein